MKRVYSNVQEVVNITCEVYNERNRFYFTDLLSAAKLAVEIRDNLKGICLDVKVRERFIRGIIVWGIFENGYSLKRLHDRVFDYLSVFEVDEYRERHIKEFIIAYTEYAAKRWGVRVGVTTEFVSGRDEKFLLAAKIAKKLCREYKIVMYQYIRAQHECWEKIQQPLSMVALSDEDRCRRRYKVYIDVEKREGQIRKEDYSNGLVKRKWKEILDMGIDKFLARSSAKGYLAYVARLYKEDVDLGLAKNELSVRYSPEAVEEKWKEVEGVVEL